MSRVVRSVEPEPALAAKAGWRQAREWPSVMVERLQCRRKEIAERCSRVRRRGIF
jgi:hypothetical protein